MKHELIKANFQACLDRRKDQYLVVTESAVLDSGNDCELLVHNYGDIGRTVINPAWEERASYLVFAENKSQFEQWRRQLDLSGCTFVSNPLQLIGLSVSLYICVFLPGYTRHPCAHAISAELARHQIKKVFPDG